MTMHRAKGTEFSKVLLFGLSDGSSPAALKDQRYSDDAWSDALSRSCRQSTMATVSQVGAVLWPMVVTAAERSQEHRQELPQFTRPPHRW